MNSTLENYKNVDKSTHLLFKEENTFKVYHFNNLASETEFFKRDLTDNYIQIFFCTSEHCVVAFNMEHCAVHLTEGNSSMVYFKDDSLKILFTLPPNAQLTAIFISIDYFHSLFANDFNNSFNFNSFRTGKPIIEPKEIGPTILLILSQLVNKQTNSFLKPLYIKGKIFELLSYYFSEQQETESENCPYVTNEETVSKVKLAKQLVLEDINNPPSLNDLAKKVGLNVKKLKNEFKEYYGSPVFTYLLNYKMELAKNLLTEQKLNVNEIATHLGYSTSSHFIAAFKRKYKITPKQYSKI